MKVLPRPTLPHRYTPRTGAAFAARELAELSAPAACAAAGLHEVVVEALQRLDRVRLRGIGSELAALDSAAIELERARSFLELDAVAEVVERLRVRERFAIHDVAAVDHVAHGELDDLAVHRARDVGNRRGSSPARGAGSPSRVSRRGCAARGRRRACAPGCSCTNSTMRVSSSQSWLTTTLSAISCELLDDAIDLRGADPHAAGIQHGVRPAVDHDAAVRRELGVVAVAPHVRESLEVSGAVLAAVGVVPEADRHRRKRRRADELAFLARARSGRSASKISTFMPRPRHCSSPR